MDKWKYFNITHNFHTMMNPMDDHKISELIDLLDISSDARVIDIGCGKAEYLIKLTKKIKLQAIGVDLHHMPLKRDERE